MLSHLHALGLLACANILTLTFALHCIDAVVTVVDRSGHDPETYRLKDDCSDQLS
jgi:hypothetical protein